jgi:hypothetical protein
MADVRKFPNKFLCAREKTVIYLHFSFRLISSLFLRADIKFIGVFLAERWVSRIVRFLSVLDSSHVFIDMIMPFRMNSSFFYDPLEMIIQ